jgi:hypothetical protein
MKKREGERVTGVDKLLYLSYTTGQELILYVDSTSVISMGAHK